MARKIYLVPADQYHDMLSSASAEAESPLLRHTKQEMQSLLKATVPKAPLPIHPTSKRPRLNRTKPKVNRTTPKVNRTKRKRGKSMNISVRKALYDQALHRYLGQRKELKERPMKVEVVNKGGAKYMVKPKSTASGDSSLLSVSPQAADVAQLNTSTPLRPPPTAPFTTPPSGEALIQERSVEEMKPTPTARKPVSQRKSKRAEKQRVKQELTAANRGEFERQVWERRNVLGIDDTGAVLGAGGKPIAGSDYKKVLQYMFSPAKQADPKGIVMRHKIINHPELGPVYKSLLTGVGTPPQKGGGKFRPAKWI